MKKKRFSVEQIVAVLKQAEPLFQNGMNTQISPVDTAHSQKSLQSQLHSGS